MENVTLVGHEGEKKQLVKMGDRSESVRDSKNTNITES